MRRVPPRTALTALRKVVDPRRDDRTGLALRTLQRYVADGMPDRAPAIAYYGMLSLFPAMLLTFSVIRFVGGDGAPAAVSHYANDHGASRALAQTIRSALRTAQSASPEGAGAVGLIGAATLVYGASRAFTALGRAIDTIGGRLPSQRSPQRRAEDIGWTLLLLLLGVITLVLAAVSGDVLHEALKWMGLSNLAANAWTIVRIPVATALALCVIAIIHWAAPTGRRRRFRLVTAGGLLSVATWMLSTLGFSVYATNFASYNATYGAFAGSVILLLWIWLGASSLLFGAVLDAVLADRRRLSTTERPGGRHGTAGTQGEVRPQA